MFLIFVSCFNLTQTKANGKCSIWMLHWLGYYLKLPMNMKCMLRHEFIICRSKARTFTTYMTISKGVSRVRESRCAVMPFVCPGPVFAWRYCDCLHDKVWVLCTWFRLQRQLIVQQFAQSTRHLAYSRLPDVILAVLLLGRLIFFKYLGEACARHLQLQQHRNVGISAIGHGEIGAVILSRRQNLRIQTLWVQYWPNVPFAYRTGCKISAWT